MLSLLYAALMLTPALASDPVRVEHLLETFDREYCEQALTRREIGLGEVVDEMKRDGLIEAGREEGALRAGIQYGELMDSGIIHHALANVLVEHGARNAKMVRNGVDSIASPLLESGEKAKVLDDVYFWVMEFLDRKSVV